MTDETVSLLRDVREQIGWRGNGPRDLDGYYCEFCRAYHGDSAQIAHTPECVCTRIDAHLAALERSQS
jgi:hypothetical protein